MRIVLALLVALAATALGAGAAEAAKPQYTNGQLALMVLPKSELGALGRGLEVEMGSGVQSNAAAAEDTLDPKDTASSSAAAGASRATPSSTTTSPSGLMRGRGVLAVGSSVDLFAVGRRARYMAKQLPTA